MLGDILLTDLFHIKDGFRGICLLDPKVDIVPMVSSLSEPSVGYHIGVESRDECNLCQQEEMLAIWCVYIDVDVAISFYIGAAISSQDRIDSI